MSRLTRRAMLGSAGKVEIMLNNFRDGVYRTLGVDHAGVFQGSTAGGTTITGSGLSTSADGDYAVISVPDFAGDFAMVAELAVSAVGASGIGGLVDFGPASVSRYAAFFYTTGAPGMRSILNGDQDAAAISGLTRVVIALSGGVVKQSFNGGSVTTGAAGSWPDTPANLLLMGNGYGALLSGSDYTHHLAGGFLRGVRIVKGTFTNAELQALTLTSTLP